MLVVGFEETNLVVEASGIQRDERRWRREGRRRFGRLGTGRKRRYRYEDVDMKIRYKRTLLDLLSACSCL